jgi:5-amino-6-(5-phosphoribosylamino)uracil reductase
MPERPYTVVSCGMSVDGYLDDATAERLVLSNDADLDRVDAERAACDAILVGAHTVRRDDPRLLVRSGRRRVERAARGEPESPTRVTITSSGKLDPCAQFFTVGDTERIVYCASGCVPDTNRELGDVATVVDCGPEPSLRWVLEDLHARGTRRLLVEGGGQIITQLLTEDLADELQLVVAPVFVGDSRAPRFVRDGSFPWTKDRRAALADVTQIGDVVLLRYALSARALAAQPTSEAVTR